MSLIAKQPRHAAAAHAPPTRRTFRFGIHRGFLSFCRTIHIYLTMMGLFVMLLFGITGFTVNHEDWFGATTPRASDTSGQTPTALIEKSDRLAIVEHLRTTFHISGAMTSFDDLDQKLSIGFKEPGQVWEIDIDKTTGTTSVHSEAFNFIDYGTSTRFFEVTQQFIDNAKLLEALQANLT